MGKAKNGEKTFTAPSQGGEEQEEVTGMWHSKRGKGPEQTPFEFYRNGVHCDSAISCYRKMMLFVVISVINRVHIIRCLVASR
jgi:hypothetical protein